MSPTLRVVLFLATLGLVFAVVGNHVFRRIVGTFRVSPRVRLSLIVLLCVGFAAAFGGRAVASTWPETASALGMLGGVVSLSIMITSVLLWPYELVRAAYGLFQKMRRRQLGTPRASSDVPTAIQPGRRAFLNQTIVGGAVSLGTGAATYGTLLGRHDYRVEEVPVALAKLPASLDGFRVMQISDIHVGLFVSEPELWRAVELMQKARPDVIVMTGDLVDHDIRYAALLGRFARKLEGIARNGVYAIAGNHDHYAGVKTVYQMLQEAGVDVLHNRHVRLGRGRDAFVLAGVDDVAAKKYGGEGPDLERAFAGATPELARVLLSHNPSFFPQASQASDLVLSGHTHGGQISLFINPAEVFLRHGYIRGHYHLGDSQLYVNRGFGTAGPPARVGSAPELTALTLIRG